MKKTAAQFIKEMGKRQNAIAKERDKLDNAIGDMEQLKEDCNEAWEALQDARDALSRMQ